MLLRGLTEPVEGRGARKSGKLITFYLKIGTAEKQPVSNLTSTEGHSILKLLYSYKLDITHTHTHTRMHEVVVPHVSSPAS